ncbi:MAG: hypothetical protein K6T37_07170 [Acidothermus cellulolyticus]|jgi:hypothetical protein|nr:hypothetical protein [Acidothermus cellulolyticus]
MNKIARVGASIVGCLAIVGFLSLTPLAGKRLQAASLNTQTTAETHTASGKVTAIEKNSLTVSVSGANMTNGSSADPAGAKSMTFVVDGNTTIDGKVQVGVNVDVIYRTDSGQNLAMNVRVAR